MRVLILIAVLALASLVPADAGATTTFGTNLSRVPDDTVADCTTLPPYGVPTSARQWQSTHNYGIAIDMYDLSSGQLVAVTNTNGNLASHFGLTWGRSFGDPPHFEKTNPDWHDLRDRRAAHTFTYEGRDYVEFP